jgi:hypothetical protein
MTPDEIAQAVDLFLKRFRGKNKPRPTVDEVLFIVQLHFSNCGCGANTHTIKEPIGEYIFTITRQKTDSKDKGKA